MDKRYEIKNQRLEEIYWWCIARRETICDLVRDLNRDVRILDVGCSGGPQMKSFIEMGYTNIYGLDISERAIDLCNKRGLNNVFVMDAEKTDFKDDEFDLLVVSDVLEHLENDELALSEWHRILKPGGKLIVFVPAFQFLWSPHDETNFHYRRYSKTSLINRFKEADFEIIRGSYWNFSLFVPGCMIKFFQRLFTRKDKDLPNQLYEVNEFTNKLLLGLLRLENKFLGKFNFPFGVSVFVIGEKSQ